MQYSNELREAVLRRVLPPNEEPISKKAAEEGISEQTIRNWREKACKEGTSAADFDVQADKWSPQDKFIIVVETAKMNLTLSTSRNTRTCHRLKSFQRWLTRENILLRSLPSIAYCVKKAWPVIRDAYRLP